MGITKETPIQVLILQAIFDAGVGIGKREIAKETRLNIDKVSNSLYHLKDKHRVVCNIGPGQYTTTELGKHIAGLSFSNPGMPIKKLIELYLKKKNQVKPSDEDITEAIKEKMLSQEEVEMKKESILPRSFIEMTGGAILPPQVPKIDPGHTKEWWEENYVSLTNRLIDLMSQKGINGNDIATIRNRVERSIGEGSRESSF